MTCYFVGPFLTALLTKLEGMIQNPFAVNFLLTGIISRLAAFPQPLLRSFLLSHNLVFQPTVKSLLQVYMHVRNVHLHFVFWILYCMFCEFPPLTWKEIKCFRLFTLTLLKKIEEKHEIINHVNKNLPKLTIRRLLYFDIL